MLEFQKQHEMLHEIIKQSVRNEEDAKIYENI